MTARRAGHSGSHHTWSGNVVTIYCIETLHNRQRFPTVVLDFDALGVARGGLLEQAIRSAPCPVHRNYVSGFRQALRAAVGDSRVAQLLSTPTGGISRAQLHDILFESFENAIDKWKTTSKYGRSHSARKIFTFVDTKLSTGDTIAGSGFKSRFPIENPSGNDLLSERYDASFDKEELAAPISAIDFKNLSELNTKALNHLETRLNRVTSACHSALDSFEALRLHLDDLKCAPPPPDISDRMLAYFREGRGPSPDLFPLLSEPARLWIVANLVERDNLHKSYLKQQVTLRGITALYPVCHTITNKVLFTSLLSSDYLPRSTLIACLLLTMTPTPWNSSVILSMTAENVKRNGDGTYTISGMKTRTAQLQERTLSSLADDEWQDIETETDACDISDEYACKALELLLWHDKNIRDARVNRLSASLFVSLNLGHLSQYTFDVIDLPEILPEFCRQYEIPLFKAKNIRDQVASIEFLRSNRDIHYVSALLGHADVGTTQRYLNSKIIKLLNAANMKRFMDHLASSIVFACGGMKRIKALNFDPAHVREQMLFPSSTTSSETGESLADKWLDSIGDMAICITEAEIKHCALQHRLYTKSLRTLIQFNQDRFIHFHFPRLIFCQALYAIIAASPHRDILRDYEETLNVA